MNRSPDNLDPGGGGSSLSLQKEFTPCSLRSPDSHSLVEISSFGCFCVFSCSSAKAMRLTSFISMYLSQSLSATEARTDRSKRALASAYQMTWRLHTISDRSTFCSKNSLTLPFAFLLTRV